MENKVIVRVSAVILLALVLILVVLVAIAIHDQVTLENMKNAVTPLVLSSGTLLFVLSSRNASISERIRVLGKETLTVANDQNDKLLRDARLQSIKKQLSFFKSRIELSNWSLGAQFVSLICSIASFLAALKSPSVAVIFLFVAIFLLTWSAGATIIELVLSHYTIREEDEFRLKAIDDLLKQNEPPTKPDVIVTLHFNRLYHDVWHKDRPKLTSGKDPRAEDAKALFARFWSLQREQFHFFRHRLLPRELFSEWMIHRRAEAAADVNICGISIKDSWKDYRDKSCDLSSFITFMDRIVNSSDDIDVLLANEEVAASRELASRAERARAIVKSIEDAAKRQGS